jgi:hypothetical protein
VQQTAAKDSAPKDGSSFYFSFVPFFAPNRQRRYPLDCGRVMFQHRQPVTGMKIMTLLDTLLAQTRIEMASYSLA